MDLPFLLPQSRIFRAYGLTPDLKMRYGSDIRFISAKSRYLCFSQYICTLDVSHILASYVEFCCQYNFMSIVLLRFFLTQELFCCVSNCRMAICNYLLNKDITIIQGGIINETRNSSED